MHYGIEIPGNGEITLKPGGDHIMFMGLSKPFKLGEKISAKLTFEKAGTIDVDFSVNAIAGKHLQNQCIITKFFISIQLIKEREKISMLLISFNSINKL